MDGEGIWLGWPIGGGNIGPADDGKGGGLNTVSGRGDGVPCCEGGMVTEYPTDDSGRFAIKLA